MEIKIGSDLHILVDWYLKKGELCALYCVKSGDTLQSIAERTLGFKERWREIYEMNKFIGLNPDRIFPGQILRVNTGFNLNRRCAGVVDRRGADRRISSMQDGGRRHNLRFDRRQS